MRPKTHAFYGRGFPRQLAQHGAYSMTARFDDPHDHAIARLLGPSRRKRYLIEPKIKTEVLEMLRHDHGIWMGSLFPDSAGAAATAKTVFGDPPATKCDPPP